MKELIGRELVSGATETLPPTYTITYSSSRSTSYLFVVYDSPCITEDSSLKKVVFSWIGTKGSAGEAKGWL